MEVARETLEQVFGEIVNSLGYVTTVGPVDKSKVTRRRAGEITKLPSARLARAAWRVAGLLATTQPPPPPPPPVKRLAPQTYNKGSSGQDARYCVLAPGVTRVADNDWVDEGGFHYDANGLCKGGRSGNPVPGLKPADQMDGREPCDPYDGMPPWPAGSYEV